MVSFIGVVHFFPELHFLDIINVVIVTVCQLLNICYSCEELVVL